MNTTYTIEELDHEEIELLPPRVVMCASNPCCQPCPPCHQTIHIYFNFRLGCFVRCDVAAG